MNAKNERPLPILRHLKNEINEYSKGGVVAEKNSIALHAYPDEIIKELRNHRVAYTFTQNSNSSALSLGTYPVLRYIQEQQIAKDDRGLYALDFSAWRQVSTRIQDSEAGEISSIEVLDNSGKVAHKICFNSSSSEIAHHCFASKFGYPDTDRVVESPNRHVSSKAPWKKDLNSRFNVLANLANDKALPLPGRFLISLLSKIAESTCPLRFQLFGTTANQNIIGKIRSYDSSNEWISCSTKSGGFNIRKGSTPNLFLVTCKCPCCEKQLWAIEAYDRNQKLLFVITTGSERYESSFRKEVNVALKGFDLM